MGQNLYGAIEAGGTKFVCSVGNSPEHITNKIHIETTIPEQTLLQVVDFFQQYSPLKSIGIASFGPINLNQKSPQYGSITTTPKQDWQNFQLLDYIKKALDVPVVIDTDVNGAVMGEQLYGAGRGLNSLAYMTVGTGIGVGCIVNNQLLKGLSHLEFGHTLIPRQTEDTKPSSCPYHHNCLEGLASGTALSRKWNVPADQIQAAEAWSLESRYLAYGLVNLIVAIMPKRIIMGGGIMKQAGLIESVRKDVVGTLNNYLQFDSITQHIDQYIVLPGLGDASGITGALVLATRALD